MSSSHELIQFLKETRKCLQVSKYKLGKQSGMSHTTIARIENGEVMPTLDTFIKIAGALGYDVTLTKKSQPSISTKEQIDKSRAYISQLYDQENKDIDNATQTLKRILKK